MQEDAQARRNGAEFSFGDSQNDSTAPARDPTFYTRSAVISYQSAILHERTHVHAHLDEPVAELSYENEEQQTQSSFEAGNQNRTFHCW